MSTWSNLVNNKWISYKDIQNGVLAGSISVYTGASISYTDQWVNKLSFSNSVPNLGTLSYFNKSDNQWITKTDIVPAIECPCTYFATYSQFYNGPSVIPGYECINIDKATAPASFSTAQRVYSNAWNREFWVSSLYRPRLYDLGFSTNGTGTYNFFGFTNSNIGGVFVVGASDALNYYNTVWVNPSHNTTQGRMNSTAVWVSNSFYTITSTSSLVNGYYTNATPVPFTTTNSVWEPLDIWIGFLYSFIPTSTKTYYFGISGDNLVRVKINGNTLIDSSLPGNDGSGEFTEWSIYPIVLNSGVNYSFSFEVYNSSQISSLDILGNPAGFAAELYDFTGLTTSSGYPVLTDALTYGITSTASLNPYILFSTKDMNGYPWNYGQSVGYYCNNGGSLYQDPNTGLYMCLAIATQSSYINNCLTLPYFTLDLDHTISSSTVSFYFGVQTSKFSVDWGDGYIEGSTSSITFVNTTSTMNFVSSTNPNLGYSQLFSQGGGGGFLNGKCYFSHYYTNPGIYTVKFMFQNSGGSGIQLNLSNIKAKNLKFYNNWVGSDSIPGIIYLNNNYISIPRQNLIIPQIATPTLTLQNNSITTFDVDYPSNYSQLDLQYNYMSIFNPSYQISSCGLLLDRNNITNFAPGNTISFLYTNGNAGQNNILSLTYNNLVNFNPYCLVGLYQLGLNNNNITTFNPSSSLPTSLSILNLQHNLINNFSLLINPIVLTTNSYFVSSIYLDYNTPLTIFNPYYINGGVSQSALSAKNISITNCSLTGSFSPDYLITVTNSLMYLDNNFITNFDPKTYLNGLIYLSISNNNITNFNPIYNPISASLSFIDISGNNISTFNPSSYSFPNSIETILYRKNPIQSFTTSYLPSNLKFLDLSYNSSLQYLNGNSFNNVNGLVYLFINYCGSFSVLNPTYSPNFGSIPFVKSGTMSYPPVYGNSTIPYSQLSNYDGFGVTNNYSKSALILSHSYLNSNGVTNGIRIVDGITFSNNLSNIIIWSNSLVQFTPLSLPTGLEILDINGNIPSNYGPFGTSLNYFNFDLLLNTNINTLKILGATGITSLTASSTLPNTLTYIALNGGVNGLSSAAKIINKLNYIQPTILPINLNYLNVSYCSLTASIIEGVLNQLITYGLTFSGANKGYIYLDHQYGVTTSVSSTMSTYLSTLLGRGWTYSI